MSQGPSLLETLTNAVTICSWKDWLS